MLASIFRFCGCREAGICYDFGVYYLTAIVSLFHVDPCRSPKKPAEARQCRPDSPEYGQNLTIQTKASFHDSGNENGVTSTFCVNGDSVINDQAVFTIYGKKGILKLVDPNNFRRRCCLHSGCKDCHSRLFRKFWIMALPTAKTAAASSVRDGRSNCRGQTKLRTQKWHITCSTRSDQIMKSAETGAFEKVPSTCERPEAMPNS